ncbi:protein of unknown function [Azospirillum baldaniorum]|uniref:Uncharacterized protein n=1 Tax=Azospirillum baldaniorum TaxID=1064539 RepID=A0A9P1NKF4_9PROT|nr:protein of unknown function [Azospirillum baldaniorum]
MPAEIQQAPGLKENKSRPLTAI